MLNSRENLSLIVLHEKQVERMIRSEGHSTHIELWAQSLKRPCFKSTPPNLDAQLCSILHRQTHTRKKEKKNSVGKTIWCNFFSAHPAFESILIQNNSSKKKKRVESAMLAIHRSKVHIFSSLFFVRWVLIRKLWLSTSWFIVSIWSRKHTFLWYQYPFAIK